MSTNPITSFTASVTGQPFLPDTQIGQTAGRSPNSLASPLQQLKQIERPAGVGSTSSSVNKENDEVDTIKISFNLIQKHDYIQTTPEDKKIVGSTITFSRPKIEVGGSNFGLFGYTDGQEYLIKAPLRLGAFKQIAERFGGDTEGAKRIAGYIVGDYIRLVHKDKSEEEKKLLQQFLQNDLFSTLEDFFKSKDGEAILDKAKADKIDISDLNAMLLSLVVQNPKLKNILTVPMFMDVFKNTAGQHLVNQYQLKTYLNSDHKLVPTSRSAPSADAASDNIFDIQSEESREISAHRLIPTSKLFVVGSNLFIGSRFLPDAVPCDQFVLKLFLPEGKELEEVRQAAELIEQAKTKTVEADKLKAAKNLISTITTPENLADGKSRLEKWEFEGLWASILMRLIEGENLDIEFGNMLGNQDKSHSIMQVFNIDIAGFRHNRMGEWAEIMKNPDALCEKLLHESVFKHRYLRGIDNENHDLQHAITEVLRKTIKSKAPSEIRQVRDWYALLDAEAAKSSLKDLYQGLLGRLVDKTTVAPDEEELEKAMDENYVFIDNRVKVASDSRNTELALVAGSSLLA